VIYIFCAHAAEVTIYDTGRHKYIGQYLDGDIPMLRETEIMKMCNLYSEGKAFPYS